MRKHSRDSPLPATPLRDTSLRYCELKAATWHPHTVRQRRYTILRLVRFLTTRFPEIQEWPQVRRHPHIEDWLQSLQSRHPVTRMDYLQVVAQFCREVQEWQWPHAPSDDLFLPTDMPRLPRRYPKPLTPDDDRRLRVALEQDPSVLGLGLRVLRETGLRIGELLDLPLDAACPNRSGQWELKVPLGKTHTERIFPLMPSALHCIQSIVQRRGLRVPGLDLPPRLMMDEKGHPVPYWTLSRHLKRTAHRAGIPNWERLHPHQLRHTFASELARAQIPLPSLMRLLGHRRPHMTLHYVELSATDVRQAYEQAVSRLPILSSLAPYVPASSPEPLSPDDRLALFLASLERERRDLPANDPQAVPLLLLVRKLQAALRGMRKQSACEQTPLC